MPESQRPDDRYLATRQTGRAVLMMRLAYQPEGSDVWMFGYRWRIGLFTIVISRGYRVVRHHPHGHASANHCVVGFVAGAVLAPPTGRFGAELGARARVCVTPATDSP